MKLINTTDAVGQVLCHDMTQIIRGVTKDARFRKGHIITEEDIPVLLSIGKEHIYVWENTEGMLHENDGAEILRQLSQGENLYPTEPKEGKITLKASCDGVLKIDSKRLLAVNSVGELMIATKLGNSYIEKDRNAAAMRVIPLMISEERMQKAREAAGDKPILSVIPIKSKKAAVVATGSEIYKGRIEDTFTPVVVDKLEALKAEVIHTCIMDDKAEMTTAAILEEIGRGAELVCVTGGMSVDPDDRTPLAIKNTGAEIVSYGAPVLPGAMFMLAYYHQKREDGSEKLIPIVGLPGCVMYAGRTVFDMMLPRLLADDIVTLEDIQSLGEGGLL